MEITNKIIILCAQNNAPTANRNDSDEINIDLYDCNKLSLVFHFASLLDIINS